MFYNYNPTTGRHSVITFNDEVYVPITDLVLPGVKPYYSVSNYGNVYSSNSGYLMSDGDNQRGYRIVALSTIYGIKTVTIHRLVMLAFCYRADHGLYEVNHKNGVKHNNCLYNLEWVTPVENMQHAYATGLNNSYGENGPDAILTNEQVHFICQCLQDGVPYENIVEQLGETGYKSLHSLFNNIRLGNCWKSIAQYYTFYDYESRIPYKFTDEQVIEICKGLERNLNYKEILVNLGYDINNMDENTLKSYNRTISYIRVGKLYKYISKDYIFHKQRSYQVFSDEQVHKICEYLEKGRSFDDILTNMGIYRDDYTKVEYFNFKSILSGIKNRTRLKKISYSYNF